MECELTLDIGTGRIDFPDEEYVMFLERIRYGTKIREKNVLLSLKEIFISEYAKLTDRTCIDNNICLFVYTPIVFIEKFDDRKEEILRTILNVSDETINPRYVAYVFCTGNSDLISEMLTKNKLIDYCHVIEELIYIRLNYDAFDEIIKAGVDINQVLCVLNGKIDRQRSIDIDCPFNQKIKMVINYLNKK